MILNAFIISLIIALIMTAVFVWGFKMKGAWSNGLAFFFIVFLASWAASIWVRPVGQAVPSNAPWLAQFITGLVASLLMSSSAPAWSRRNVPEGAAAQQIERRTPPVTMLTPAYWLVLVILVVSIIVR